MRNQGRFNYSPRIKWINYLSNNYNHNLNNYHHKSNNLLNNRWYSNSCHEKCFHIITIIDTTIILTVMNMIIISPLMIINKLKVTMILSQCPEICTITPLTLTMIINIIWVKIKCLKWYHRLGSLKARMIPINNYSENHIKYI